MLAVIAALAMSSQAVPSPRQLAWHEMEQYAFIHFGPNTFTNAEWGEGKEDPKLFAPTQLDCDQWVSAAKAGGLNGIILTAKHHDGFCLWPSKFSTHTVRESGYKGDVLKELSVACKKGGLKMGLYLSPWDRNHPTYGTPEYNQVFANMIKEVLTQYGDIFEFWLDGANGEGPNGKKQVYDWKLIIDTIRKYQPNAVIFSDAGPDIRWVGNEAGHSDPECWATIDRDRYVPGTPLYAELTKGSATGKDWVPAECDVSIRPGWFYHKEEDDNVKSPETLLKLWEESVGQNASFLLNLPPDRRGLIHENDVAALVGFKKLRDKIYGNDLAKDAQVGVSTDAVMVDLRKPVTFDRVELREPIKDGQHINGFEIQVAGGDNNWKVVSRQTTIGARRIVRIEPVTASQIRIKLDTPNRIGKVSVYKS